MKKLIPIFLSAANAVGIAVYLWKNKTDAMIPIHYNIKGEADRYGSKWMLLVIAAVPLLLSLGYLIYRACSRGSESAEKNAKYEDICIPAIVVLFIGLTWLLTFETFSGSEKLSARAGSIVLMFLSLLLTFTGNIMPKVKHNRFFGIRTSATLKDETVWKRTHRLGGYTSTAFGVVTLVCSVIGLICNDGKSNIWAACGVAAIIVGVFIPVLYSYALYARLHRKADRLGDD